jgi:7,8-dihydroneopterin aldolase/epimerase/oxygenase
MDQIIIDELEVHYRVGVTDLERSRPQRLLLNLVIHCDASAAAATDDLGRTIDYYAVTRRLLAFGEGQSWRLIEKVAGDIAALVLTEFRAASVSVEVRKFIIPEARYVAVRLTRAAPRESGATLPCPVPGPS